MYLRYIFTIIFIFTAGITDKKINKIPNFLILIGFIIGFLFNFFIDKLSLYDNCLRLIVCIIIFFVGMLRILGGGDIKLWMVLNILIGSIESAIAIMTASVLIILFAVFSDKNNMLKVYVSLLKAKNKDFSVEKGKENEKGYPLALFLIIPVVTISILKMVSAI